MDDAESSDEERGEQPAVVDLEVDGEDANLVKGGIPKQPDD